MDAIAILGTGKVGAILASRLAGVGWTVCLGSRDPGLAASRWNGPEVSFHGPEEAAERAALIINATPGDTSLERLGALRPHLAGKIVVDVSNAAFRGEDGFIERLLFPDSSLGERLQSALPGARVVKTLNTMSAAVMTDPGSLSVRPTAFLSADDPDAKAVVRSLLNQLGWPTAWIEDLGGIATARAAESLVLLAPHILRRRGPAPFAISISE